MVQSEHKVAWCAQLLMLCLFLVYHNILTQVHPLQLPPTLQRAAEQPLQDRSAVHLRQSAGLHHHLPVWRPEHQQAVRHSVGH